LTEKIDTGEPSSEEKIVKQEELIADLEYAMSIEKDTTEQTKISNKIGRERGKLKFM
jgi:hypothetical protein